MYKYLIALFFLVISHYSAAATKQYLLIENEIDNEYFVTPTVVDPRFSGSNKMSTYDIGQQSLGYMGNNMPYLYGAYVDIWLEDSPISKPFLGIRCLNIYPASCPSNGLISDSSTMLDDGVYHVQGAKKDAESAYSRAVFSDSFYQYLSGLSVGSSPTLNFNYCYTKNNYDPLKGETCQNKGGTSGSQKFEIKKIAHLKLSKTNSLQEIYVDTNGKPNLTSNSHLCSKITINKIEGVACKLVNYTLNGNLSSFLTNLKINMETIYVPDSKKDLQFSNSLSTSASWHAYDSITAYGKDLFSSSNDSIYVFFSNNYLMKIINSQSDLSQISKGFSFIFRNSLLLQSGYYQFTPSNQIVIKAKEHSISIVHSDYSIDKSLTGAVGSSTPITFDYLVAVSSEKLADKITASVSGPTINVNGQTYCKFTSEDEKTVVPFPAYLSFKKSSGASLEKKPANCDNKVIDITKTLWKETAWNDLPDKDNNSDGGFLWQTNIQLNFPMDDTISLKTVDSKDWEGSVSATGTITVNAEWLSEN